MKHSPKSVVRVLAAAAILAAAAGASTPRAEAATVIDRGCAYPKLTYSDVSDYRVCSWAVDYGSFYAYVDQWETNSSYNFGQAFGWHPTAKRVFVYQLLNNEWVKYSCGWSWPNGATQGC